MCKVRHFVISLCIFLAAFAFAQGMPGPQRLQLRDVVVMLQMVIDNAKLAKDERIAAEGGLASLAQAAAGYSSYETMLSSGWQLIKVKVNASK